MMMMACKRLEKLKCLIAFSWLLLKILRGLAGGGKAGKGEVSETCEEHQDSSHETHTKKNERRAHTGDQWEAQKRIESYYQLLSYLFLCFYIFHCSSSTKIAQFCEWMAWVHKRRYNLNHLPQKRSSLSVLFCLIPSILTTQKDLTHFTGSFWKLQFPFSIALQSTGSKNILSCSSNLIDFYPIFPFAIGWCVLFFLWF